MAGYRKLSGKDLRIGFDFLPEFEYTTEISPYKGLVGQDNAVETLEYGLMLDCCNLFVAGNHGTGKSSYVKQRLLEIASKLEDSKAIYDWCYVNNFIEKDKPRALRLQAGKAVDFKEDLGNLIFELIAEVPKYFSGAVMEKIQSQIMNRHQKRILQIVDVLYAESRKKDFVVKNSGDGFVFTPLYNGEEMTETQYNELEDEEKDKINEAVGELKTIALEVMRKSRMVKRELVEELRELNEKSAKPIVGEKLNRLSEKYADSPEINVFLEEVRSDLIENIEQFIDDQSDKDEQFAEFIRRYTVNIMRNGKETPVVIEEYPDCHNLVGRIEYENKSSSLVTDFTMIQPGALHKANGGYLMLDAWQMLTSSGSWELLKRCIKNKRIYIDSNRSGLDFFPIASFKPQEIPIQVKVVLVGTPYLYYLLLNNDEEFEELFPIKVNFDNELENTNGTALKLLGFISSYCEEKKLLPISRKAITEIFRMSLRRAENKRYFDSGLSKVAGLLEQTSKLAEAAGADAVEETHVREFERLHQRQHGYYRDRVLEMYKEGKYLIDINGCRVGQINGLTVIDHTDFSFGKPARITVTTFAGKEGVVNIEREVSMSGSIHNKGIMILSGFIGKTFGQDSSLSFNASICFEQLYGEVDGDSASAAELIALLSSLGDIPIRQNLAVTGSINQRGEIQPIGGVNEKIEGFYQICKSLSLTGEQGVVIPNTNIGDLLLDREVTAAIEKGEFHIYAVETIEDCFELLCEDALRKQGRKKVFELVKKRVNEKLKKYNNIYSGGSKEQ